MNQAVGDQRLLKLAAFLKTVPRKRFDYAVWVGHDWQGAQDLSCGTTACALGWAATMPEFRRLGLRLKAFVYGRGGYVVLQRERTNDPFKVGEKLFDISPSESLFLFSPQIRETNHHATPKQVAAHIERFVKNRQRARATA